MIPAATGPDAPSLLRQQLRLVVALALLALVALVLPLAALEVPLVHYLPLHTALEFIAIAAAFLVFATVWHSPAREVSASLVLIATALFAAGWLDFGHALSLKGMPALVTPASSEKGIAFWLLARLLVAVTLLLVSGWPQLPPLTPWARNAVLAGYASLGLFLGWLVITHETALPHTFVEGLGLTPFKWQLECVITTLLALAALRYFRLARASGGDAVLPLLFGAAATAALGELFFTRYTVANDGQNLLGHLYKFVSYGLLYRALFVVTVRKPYQRLTQQAQALALANERLRTQALALQSTATPVVVTDLQGRVRWRNRASQALLPTLSLEDSQVTSLFEAPATPDPRQQQELRAVVGAGGTWRGLVELAISADRRVLLDRTVTPLRNDDGVVEGFVSVSEDITERLQVLSRHKRVLDTVLDGFWMLDTEGRLLEANQAYAQMSGYPLAALVGKHISDLEAEEGVRDVRSHLARILVDGHDRFETRHRHHDGHSFPVEVSVTYDPSSHRLYVFIRDSSERQRAAAEKLDLERQLQQSQKVQALGQLTGGIAHDFNNVLAAVLGYANLALERHVPDPQSKLAAYLREVIAASERARDLVAKMLTFTRIQTSAGASVIAPAALVREVVAMLRPSIPSGIAIHSRLDEALHIRIDPVELNQMLVNLLINARDAIGAQGQIEIVLQRDEVQGALCAASQQRIAGRFVALDVSDDGCGIAPEHLPRLFDPFFTTKDVGQGTGLGLSMVQGILRRSNGYVLVQARPEGGSRFRLLFPEVAVPQDAVAPSAPPDDQPVGAGQCIWVVDDEAAVAGYLGELLAGAGYRVRLFGDPTHVLDAFAAEPDPPDLVLTDQTMAGLSGLALAQRLQRLRPGLPIILCTGYGGDIDHAELPLRGIRHLFSKPVSAGQLLQAVADALAVPAAAP